MAKREYHEWCNFWWENAPDLSSPRILMIGGSITNQYRGEVQKIMKERSLTYLVDMTIGSRGSIDPAWTAELDYMMSAVNGYDYALVHLNNGLHAMHLTPEEYESGMRRYIEKLCACLPNAKKALVTSTPTRDEKSLETVRKRNEIVFKLSAEYGMPVDDLFSAVDIASDPWSDGVHFKPEAVMTLAETVSGFIIKQLDS